MVPRSSYPAYRLVKLTVITSRYASITDLAWQQILDPFPLIIAQKLMATHLLK
jgi:hypothetical protein